MTLDFLVSNSKLFISKSGTIVLFLRFLLEEYFECFESFECFETESLLVIDLLKLSLLEPVELTLFSLSEDLPLKPKDEAL